MYISTFKMIKLFAVCLVVVAVLAQEFPSEADNTKYYTTNYGAPIADDDNSLTVGVRGPVLLEGIAKIVVLQKN